MTTARCLVSLEQIIISGSLACFAHNVVQPGPFGLGQCRLASRKRSWELIQGSLGNPSSATTLFFCAFNNLRELPSACRLRDCRWTPDRTCMLVGMSTTGRIGLTCVGLISVFSILNEGWWVLCNGVAVRDPCWLLLWYEIAWWRNAGYVFALGRAFGEEKRRWWMREVRGFAASHAEWFWVANVLLDVTDVVSVCVAG